MLRGLTTVTYFAQDLAAARTWYTELLGMEPYFNRGAYIEYRIGDYQHELGLLDAKYAPHGIATGSGGAITYWAVDDIQASLNHLLALGATTHEGVSERGEGFITASVLDPFGNLLGIMENAHYMAVLGALKEHAASA